MRDFILLQLKLVKDNKNTVPIEKLEKFIGTYITQEEFNDATKEGDII